MPHAAPPPIALVVGARPNFMKAAPVLHALRARPSVRAVLIHTGQHHDPAMSDAFFDDLALPRPDEWLGIHGGSHAEQTARLLMALDEVFARIAPAAVVVFGDVNSTLAASLVAAKRGIPVAHVEAGLRSGDRHMPEEINRLVTDTLAARLYTPTRAAGATLRHEGHADAAIAFVGNVMIDSLRTCLPRAAVSRVRARIGVGGTDLVLLTLHRPSNVDDPAQLARLLAGVADGVGETPVVFPVHPRTRAMLAAPGFAWALPATWYVTEPLGYLDFLHLLATARAVVTDSGGVQEETTVLGVPCLTLRETTERPITVLEGTNRLLGADAARIAPALRATLTARRPAAETVRAPELWDGDTAARIADDLVAWLLPELRR